MMAKQYTKRFDSLNSAKGLSSAHVLKTMLFHVTVILLRKVADDSRNMLQFPHNFKNIPGVTDFLLMRFIIFYNFVQHIFQFW